MLRAVLSLLYRSILFMLLGAMIVVVSLRYGPTLLANTLPADMRPDPATLSEMTPDKVIRDMHNIRGALD